MDIDASDSMAITSISLIGENNGSAGILGHKIVFDPGNDFDVLAQGETQDVTINYTMTDGQSTSMSSVVITITGTNDTPRAVADTADTLENELITIDVLSNDEDLDGPDTLNIVSASILNGSNDADAASVSVVDNQLVFDPGSEFEYLAPGETEDVTLNYTIEDASGATDSASVTVTVSGAEEGLIIKGTQGSDTLYGDSGDDSIKGGQGDDTLYGNAGDDTIRGGRGDDTLHGGSGDDTMKGDAGDDTLYGGSGDDTMKGGKGDDALHGEAGDDSINAGQGDDTVYGGVGDDWITAGSGDDNITGGLGDDIVFGGQGDDTFHYAEGDGNDFFAGGQGNWTDAINLTDISTDPGGGDWTMVIDNAANYTIDVDENVIEFDNSASGNIILSGGETLAFEDVEKITWGA